MFGEFGKNNVKKKFWSKLGWSYLIYLLPKILKK